MVVKLKRDPHAPSCHRTCSELWKLFLGHDTSVAEIMNSIPPSRLSGTAKGGHSIIRLRHNILRLAARMNGEVNRAEAR